MDKEELKSMSCLEVVINDKTYTTKKINAMRRSIILKKLLGNISGGEISSQFQGFGDCLESVGPVLWEFIKDDDKKDIGTLETLNECLEDESAMVFFQWCFVKTKEITDFLTENPVK